jgi:hypothetical protein
MLSSRGPANRAYCLTSFERAKISLTSGEKSYLHSSEAYSRKLSITYLEIIRHLLSSSILSPADLLLLILVSNIMCHSRDFISISTECTGVQPGVRTMPESNGVWHAWNGGYVRGSDDSAVCCSTGVANLVVWERETADDLESISSRYSRVVLVPSYRAHSICSNEKIYEVSKAVLEFQKQFARRLLLDSD